jgi:hypothetical protein
MLTGRIPSRLLAVAGRRAGGLASRGRLRRAGAACWLCVVGVGFVAAKLLSAFTTLRSGLLVLVPLDPSFVVPRLGDPPVLIRNACCKMRLFFCYMGRNCTREAV